ncbi:MAG: right-handed parallel beta-helix repeat-containing protein, partial [Acidobacteriota bacterium]
QKMELSPWRALNVGRVAPAMLLALCWMAASGPAAAAIFTVTTTANSGSGSLRTALHRANREPGSTIVFAIPPDDPGYDRSRGVFRIEISRRLPPLRGAGTVLDGATQFTLTGNTNTTMLGTGGTAGVDSLPLPRMDGPEIEITDGAHVSIGLDIQAQDVVIRGVAIYGFGRRGDADDSGDIRLTERARETVLQSNVIGTPADAFVGPVRHPSEGDNVRSAGAVSVTVRGNLIGHGRGQGIGLGRGSRDWRIQENEIAGAGIGSGDLDGIKVGGQSKGILVRGNLLVNSGGCGIDAFGSPGHHRFENNTIVGNGLGAGARMETAGIRLDGQGSEIGRNILAGNSGAGVMVATGAQKNLITRNRIAGNGLVYGQIGIDLLEPGNDPRRGSSPYVTRNDGDDLDHGGNGLLNYPLIMAAFTDGIHLGLAGFARPGSSIELFIAAPDASGFGEGMTYLLTLVEGSADDGDPGTASYHSPLRGVDVGNDTTHRFRFLVPLPPGVSAGTILTSSAGLNGNTSEFGPNIRVLTAP